MPGTAKTIPDFSLENKYMNKIIAGVDEVGRGPLAGPVVAAAVVLNRSMEIKGINDSKSLSKAIREKLYNQITRNSLFEISVINESIIDEVNILQASLLAMKNSLEKLIKKPDVALIDGNKAPNVDWCELQTVINGDSLSISIAAASIIAKVTRDKIMKELHQLYPHYGWDRNAGYGTREHIEAIEKFGISPHHRKSFAPVRKYIMEFS